MFTNYFFYFFFNDTATTEIYTLSLHDALPILRPEGGADGLSPELDGVGRVGQQRPVPEQSLAGGFIDRKSTRLNSSHVEISYAVFCLKKKKKKYTQTL